MNQRAMRLLRQAAKHLERPMSWVTSDAIEEYAVRLLPDLARPSNEAMPNSKRGPASVARKRVTGASTV